MKAVFEYSHLGGAEILKARYPEIDAAIDETIVAIGDDFRTFQSRESGRRSRGLLYAPIAILSVDSPRKGNALASWRGA